MRPLHTLLHLAATVTCLALLAAPAHAASEFEAEEFPLTVNGTQEGSQVMTVEDELSLSCSEAQLSGVSAQPAETMTLIPDYDGCKFQSVSATVEANDCAYVLHTGAEIEGKGSFEGTLDISCPSEKTITVVAGTCEIKVGTQSSLSKVEYVNNPSAEPKPTITAKLSLTGIKYNKTKDGFLCPLTGTGEKSTGTYSGSVVLSGKDQGGAAKAMQVGKKTETVLCKDKKPDAKTGCNETYKGTNFEADAGTSTTFFLEQSTVYCNKSKLSGATKVEKGAPLPLEGLMITFADCKREKTQDCAKVTMTNSPTGSMVALPAAFSLGNGFITMPMSVFIECAPGGTVVLKCSYTKDALSLRLTGGTPATLSGLYLPLLKVPAIGEVGCSDTVSWYSSWTVTTPTQVWMYKPS